MTKTGLRVRLTAHASHNSGTYPHCGTPEVYLDWIPVTVCYQTEGCVPLDGSVELTVIQFSTNAQLVIEPVVVTSANAADIAAAIRGISQMGDYTCISCGAVRFEGEMVKVRALSQRQRITYTGQIRSCINGLLTLDTGDAEAVEIELPDILDASLIGQEYKIDKKTGSSKRDKRTKSAERKKRGGKRKGDQK